MSVTHWAHAGHNLAPSTYVIQWINPGTLCGGEMTGNADACLCNTAVTGFYDTGCMDSEIMQEGPS